MQTFLEQVAANILEKHPRDLLQVCVVTPNRRAVLFLTKYFSSLINQASWAPEVMSMEDFVSSTTNVTISEPVTLLLDLYKVVQKMDGNQAEPLEEFLKWAPLLIKDFNDIDAHVPEPQKLFDNVMDLKNIEAWNPDGSPPTAFQKRYLAFFEKIQKYHAAFKEHLWKRKSAYQGLAYRWAAQAIQKEDATFPWNKIYWAGFNALNQAEEVIIQTLIKKGLAQSFWDSDKYYTSNKNHEAGMFLRKYKQEWIEGPLHFEGDHFSTLPKKIHVYGVAKNVNQAKLAGNILTTFSAESLKNHQSAVVLANEELLLPMMNSIPKNIDTVNITMGYPLRKTSLYSFFESIFQMHLTTLRMKTARENLKSVFYYKDLIRFLNHPVTAVLWGDQSSHTAVNVLIKKITLSNRAFLSYQALASMTDDKELFEKKIGFLFEGFALHPHNSLAAFHKLLLELDVAFRQKAINQNVAIEQSNWITDFESLYSMGIIFRKLDTLLKDHNEINDFRLIFMLFQAMAREARLSLSGEPLIGLQIMGMLETRNLDFKNIIILSANEDILPASKGTNSLIPFDVKTQFGIPVYKEKDAIYAYHFYRLLQRADNIHIIYNTQARDLGSSEKSRFITQLQLEMPAWNPNIKITERIIALPPAMDNFEHEIKISKSDAIMQKLEQINIKGFSPSALNHYIKCSLFFYFRHIANIRENETLEETMEARTMGNVLHETLQQLYQEQNLEGKVLKTEHIDIMLSRLETIMREKFESIFEGGDISSGKNLLLSKVANRYLKNFLNHEKMSLEEHKRNNEYLTYLRAEEQLKATLPLIDKGQKRTLNFRGFADRIDQLDGTTRIIDYKSGRVAKEELKFKEWNQVTEDVGLGKSFQLLMYAMLYKQTHPSAADIVPGIFSLRNISSGLQCLDSPEGNKTVSNDAIQAFENELMKLMKEIYNHDLPFMRTSNEDNCKGCDFRIVCNRQ